MVDHTQKLKNPPIVEAVIDIECDLPPDMKIEELGKRAGEAFQLEYPKVQPRFLFEHHFEAKPDSETPPKTSTRRGIDGFLFKKEDEKQLVQVRRQGFSFNRLKPYSTLEEYLPEVERTWRVFSNFAKPVKVKAVRLRYINRLEIPLTGEKVILDDFFLLGPRLPDEDNLAFVGFLNQHLAVEQVTGNFVQIILTTEKSGEYALPVIFDIATWSEKPAEPDDWPELCARIDSLKNLKNRVFFNTLTEKCLLLFQ